MSDLIDRQAAIDVLDKHLRTTDVPASYPGIISALTEWLNELPPVQPERKKGAWINEGRIIRCSNCKIGYAAVKGMKSALTYNFCPNCGADMRGDKDETD